MTKIKKSTLATLNKFVKQKPFVLKNMKKWFGGQEVHVIRKNYKGLKEFPSELVGTAAAHGVNALDRVWLDKGEVAEGTMLDLCYGLAKDPKITAITISPVVAFERARTIVKDCYEKGYIELCNKDGYTDAVAWQNLPLKDIWFRLSNKFIDLLIADLI